MLLDGATCRQIPGHRYVIQLQRPGRCPPDPLWGEHTAFKLQPPQEDDSLRFAYNRHPWSAMWYAIDPSNSSFAAIAYCL